MKTNKLYWGTLAVVLGLTACTNEAEEFSNTPEGAVRFNSSINLGTKVNEAGDAWTGGEAVGIYMIGETGFTAIPGAENKEYTTNASGELSPKDGTHIFYPSDGGKVKFVAYYPYANISGNIYKIDLAATGDKDLMYAATQESYDKTNQSAVKLEFAHQLSLLTLNVKSEAGAEATGVTAQITRNTTADFNLENATLSNVGGSKAVDMTANGATLKALVMPGTDATSKVVFTLDGKNYTWNLGTIDFKAGTNYSYTINLKGQVGSDVEASLNSSIKGWELVSNSQNVNQDATAGVEYTGAVFAGKLTQGALIEGAKITVNYINGDASEQTVTTVVEGAAAAGITVAEKQVTLVKGEGSFDLEVAGTPEAAGDVTFSVKIGENVIATTHTTVAAGEQGDAPVYTSNIALPEGYDSTNKVASDIVFTIDSKDYNTIKLGNSSAIGKWTSAAIGTGKTKMDFYAAAWGGKTSILKITVNNGGSFADGATSKTFNLTGKEGLAGSDKKYAVTVNPETDFFNAELKDITEATTLTFETEKTSGKDCRAFIWGININ